MEDLNYSLLCKYCFEVLESSFSKNPKEIIFPEEFKGKSYPLFVTWTTGKEKELRGCIGTFKSDELEKNLKKYALKSAFDDDRFDPIEKKEIKNLNCEVSLLVKFKKAKNPMDWTVGKHGIDIEFEDDLGNTYSSTFLPLLPLHHRGLSSQRGSHRLRRGIRKERLCRDYSSACHCHSSRSGFGQDGCLP